MWKIAWAGDTVVGQVKSFINPQENAEMGYLRGYAEYISTHAEWRNKGIAGALLAASLREIKARGMTEAALGVDTVESGRGVPAVHQVGIRTPRLRGGIRQAVDLNLRRIWSATMASDDAAVHPFRIDVADEVLDDLRRRLAQTRWPEAELVDDWSQGAPLAWIQDMCDYWANELRLARSRSTIEPLRSIHHDDRRARHPLHPSTIAAPRGASRWSSPTDGQVRSSSSTRSSSRSPTQLAHGGQAADAFHVICPTLPGFGFSGKPTETGWGVERIADAWAVLMARLGYDRYFAQGGDWGSAVTRSIGAQDAEHCEAIHVTLAMGTRPRLDGDPKPDELRAMKGGEYYQTWDSGYSKQQATRPQTLGYGLADSPAGQAAWILEKFWAWTDCDGHPENVLNRDELLDNVMLYWATNSATSSARIYWESFGKPRAVQTLGAGRRGGVSEGDRHAGALVDGGRLSQHRSLVRAAQGRPLRRVRAARTVRRRHPNVLPPIPLTRRSTSAIRRRAVLSSPSRLVFHRGASAPRSAARTRWSESRHHAADRASGSRR